MTFFGALPPLTTGAAPSVIFPVIRYAKPHEFSGGEVKRSRGQKARG